MLVEIFFFVNYEVIIYMNNTCMFVELILHVMLYASGRERPHIPDLCSDNMLVAFFFLEISR